MPFELLASSVDAADAGMLAAEGAVAVVGTVGLLGACQRSSDSEEQYNRRKQLFKERSFVTKVPACLPCIRTTDIEPCADILRYFLAPLALLPIFDLLSDLAAFIEFVSAGQAGYAIILMVILVLNWRFVTIYAALTPRPSPVAVVIMFIPFLLHIPALFDVVTRDATEKTTEEDDELLLYDLGVEEAAPLAEVVHESVPSAASPFVGVQEATMDQTRLRPVFKALDWAGKGDVNEGTEVQTEKQRTWRQRLTRREGVPLHREADSDKQLKAEVETLRQRNARLEAMAQERFDALQRLQSDNTSLQNKLDAMMRSKENMVRDSMSMTEELVTTLYGRELRMVRWLLHSCREQMHTSWAWLLWYEALLTLSSPFLGPLFVWRGAVTLSVTSAFKGHESIPGVPAEVTERHRQYNRMLSIVEAVFESLPQLILQSRVFVKYPGTMTLGVFAFSATCSCAGIIKALVEFCVHRDQIWKLLRPPKTLFDEEDTPQTHYDERIKKAKMRAEENRKREEDTRRRTRMTAERDMNDMKRDYLTQLKQTQQHAQMEVTRRKDAMMEKDALQMRLESDARMEKDALQMRLESRRGRRLERKEMERKEIEMRAEVEALKQALIAKEAAGVGSFKASVTASRAAEAAVV